IDQRRGIGERRGPADGDEKSMLRFARRLSRRLPRRWLTRHGAPHRATAGKVFDSTHSDKTGPWCVRSGRRILEGLIRIGGEVRELQVRQRQRNVQIVPVLRDQRIEPNLFALVTRDLFYVCRRGW